MPFNSEFKKVGELYLPAFSGTRVMMLPVMLGDDESIPEFLHHYKNAVSGLFQMADEDHIGKVGYLTIDEKAVKPKATHRRAGLHVDGVYQGESGAWGGGKGTGGGWGARGAGMLTVASHPGCRAWNQDFTGWPGWEGECDHLAEELQGLGTLFGANEVYWVDGMCVHESVPQPVEVNRQFVRLSMPSDAPWFECYTVNPLGVMPTGEILPRREFMNQ